MSIANTTVEQLIGQRLDAIDQALLGLLPRQVRLAAVAQVETRIRDAVAASPAMAAHSLVPNQGVTLPDSASSNLATEAPASLLDPPFFSLASSGRFPLNQKRRSRLAVAAGVLGIFALVLLFGIPVTYVAVETVGEFLGDFLAISILGAHAVAVAVGGVAAVGLGISALVSLRRHREQLVGQGWAITGLCTGPVPMLAGSATILVFGLQLGISQFFTASEPSVACDADSPPASEPPAGIGPLAISVAPVEAQSPQSYYSQPPMQPAGYEAPTAVTRLPSADANNALPTRPAVPFNPSPASPTPRPEPRTQAEPQSAPCLEPPFDSDSSPISAPAIGETS